EVEIGAPVFGAEARVTLDGAVSLVDGEGDANLTIERLDGDGALTLSAAYANADQVLDLDLSLEEAEDGIFANLAELPGRPSVAFSVAGNAPIANFAADIRLATDGAERLAGQVTLSQANDGARRVTARISGDIAPVFAPEYRPFFGDAIDLNTEAVIAPDGQILVPRLALSTEAISLSGALEFGADRLPRLVTLKGEIASADGAPVLLPIGGAETRISRVDLALFFDASQSEDWTGNIRLTDLDRAGLAAERLALLGRGRIASGAAPEVIATLRFDARALDTGSRGLTDALGPDVNGEARITWQGGPVLLESLQLNAKALTASGNAEIAVAEEGPEVLGTLRLDAKRLADFSTLAGRDLGGAADLNTTFRALPLAGAFDIRASGSATDLTIGEPRADAILAGRAELGLQVSRDADGIHIQLDRLATDTADVTARADLRSGGSDVSLEAALKDTALLLPALQGPSRITLTGREDTARDWAVTANLAGPGFGAGIDGRLSDIYDLPEFDGTVTAQADDLSAFADLAGRPLRGQLAIEAEGRVNGDLSRVALSAVANGRDVAIGQAETDRLLAGELSATIDAERSEDVVEVAEFDLSTALLDLEAAGQLAKRDSQLTVNARLADLAPFAAGFSGPLSVTGTIGQGDQTSLTLDLDATGPGGARASLTGSVEPDLS
ncbi:MAG: hypothetical protein KJN93_01825, partial [Alphaproteobacteria bacterium]|nr:hypothetical protein [Alphaproteobacteria bacterium]